MNIQKSLNQVRQAKPVISYRYKKEKSIEHENEHGDTCFKQLLVSLKIPSK